MRASVKHRTPPKIGGIYAAYLSGLNLLINGLPVQPQTSNKGRDGNWVRIVLTSVDYVSLSFVYQVSLNVIKSQTYNGLMST
jgi:hypothetical protein